MELNIVITIALAVTLFIFGFFSIHQRKFFLKAHSIFYIPTFIILICLYYFGSEGASFEESFFESIGKTVKAITFEPFFDDLKPEYANDVWFITNYSIALVFTYYITISWTFDLFFKKALNFIKYLFVKNGTVVVLMEDDEDAKIFLESCKRKVAVIDRPHKELEKYLLDKHITYFIGINEKNLTRFKKKKDIKIVSLLKQRKLQVAAIKWLLTLGNNNQIYFHVEQEFSYAIENMAVKNNNIFIFSKHQLIADKFVMEHPLARLLNDQYIDRETGILHPDTEINVVMLGFGHTNSELFLELIKNSLFPKIINEKLKLYPLNYYVFDKNEIESSNLNHQLRRTDYNENHDDYFGWPDQSFKFNSVNIDINDFDFYKHFKKSLTKKGLNVVVISLGPDLTNLDMAFKISDKIMELDLMDNCKIFAKTRHKINIESDVYKHIIQFGCDEDVLNENVITKGDLLILAKQGALNYKKTHPYNDEDVSKLTANNVWNTSAMVDKISNMNSAFSIYNKLALFGYDLIKDKNVKGLTVEEFDAFYDPDHEKADLKDDEGNIFSQNLNPRNVLAFIEHARWNEDQLSRGYAPMKKQLVKIVNHKLVNKDKVRRYHACLVNFDELDNYFDYCTDLLMKEEHLSKDEAFSIVENKKYDYEWIDTLTDMIKGTDLKIIKRK